MTAPLPGDALNEEPALLEGEEHLYLYADTPELSCLGGPMPFGEAVTLLSKCSDDIFRDPATRFGAVPRGIIDTYIAPMAIPRRSLAGAILVMRRVELVRGFRRNRLYTKASILALADQPVPDWIRSRFLSRHRLIYVKYEKYWTEEECCFHLGEISMVAEPICTLPCGLMLCRNGRDDILFLLNVETGRSALLDYVDRPLPIGKMVDDFGEEYDALA